jgi:hypothetical protein
MDNSYEEFKENDLTGWTDLTEQLQTRPVHVMTKIMDDALANGFEFKLQGSHIYYRERVE